MEGISLYFMNVQREDGKRVFYFENDWMQYAIQLLGCCSLSHANQQFF